MKELESKVVVVTGATRGIGKAIAEAIAKEGADVAFTYMSSDEKARVLEQQLSSTGIKAKGYKCDAADFNAVDEMIAAVAEEFGTIDVLVNNAGITKDGLLMRMGEDAWDDVMNTNAKSVFNCTKAVQKIMLKKRSGSIINMSSVVGVKGNAGQSNYAASKAAIIGFTKSIAQELGSRNIRCNAIAPGFIATEMTSVLDEKLVEQWVAGIPLKRAGSTQDVSDLVVFLASEKSA